MVKFNGMLIFFYIRLQMGDKKALCRLPKYLFNNTPMVMKKLLTLTGALLLWQTMAMAQNYLHITVDDSTKMIVPTAELDSVTVRDAKFYDEEWEYVTTGTYQFTKVFTSVSTSPVYIRQMEESHQWQIKFESWLYDGYPLIIDYNDSTGRCHVQPQPTGYVHSTYGMIMATDGATYTGEEEEYPSYFHKDRNTFELFMVYYVEEGTFGYGYEYLGLDTEVAAAPARVRKQKMAEPEIKSMELVPFEAARKVEQQAPAIVELKVPMKEHAPKGAPKANKGTATSMQLKMAPKNDIIK